MTHRECIKAWLATIQLKDVYVIDWGSGSKPAMRYIQHDNCSFTTIDQNKLIDSERRSKDHIVWDITQKIVFPAKADIAFCIEVLEHSIYTQEILKNIHDNLRTDGKLYLTMPYDFPIHSEDDSLRFTEYGLRQALRRADFEVLSFQYTDNNQGYLVEAIAL